MKNLLICPQIKRGGREVKGKEDVRMSLKKVIAWYSTISMLVGKGTTAQHFVVVENENSIFYYLYCLLLLLWQPNEERKMSTWIFLTYAKQWHMSTIRY